MQWGNKGFRLSVCFFASTSRYNRSRHVPGGRERNPRLGGLMEGGSRRGAERPAERGRDGSRTVRIRRARSPSPQRTYACQYNREKGPADERIDHGGGRQARIERAGP